MYICPMCGKFKGVSFDYNKDGSFISNCPCCGEGIALVVLKVDKTSQDVPLDVVGHSGDS